MTFRHPAEFVSLSDEDGVLAVGDTAWFAALLRRAPGLEIDGDPCQEDWGVVFHVRRGRRKFWIGLSAWDVEGVEKGGPGAWLVHVHHGSFAWVQRFSLTGAGELKRLLADVQTVLASEAAISDIAWHE